MLHPVLLIRHGESTWNQLGLTQGQIAHPRLTDRGREQSLAAAERLIRVLGSAPVDVMLLSSDLARARETAEIVALELGLPMCEDERLRERHFGRWQGGGYAAALQWLVAHPHDDTAPDGGESLLDVRRRLNAVLDSLDPTRAHVLVTHGEVIRAARSCGRRVPHPDSSLRVVPNGSVLRREGVSDHWNVIE